MSEGKKPKRPFALSQGARGEESGEAFLNWAIEEIGLEGILEKDGVHGVCHCLGRGQLRYHIFPPKANKKLLASTSIRLGLLSLFS